MRVTKTYAVIISKPAQKDFDRLDTPVQQRLAPELLALATTPRPPGCERLQGTDDVWRIRIGDWRVLYTIADQRVTILVLRIRHRREVYRGR